VTACVASSMRSPVTTSLGWFHASRLGIRRAFSDKNGGVKGFSSWMGFGAGRFGFAGKTGLFVLANAPRTATSSAPARCGRCSPKF